MYILLGDMYGTMFEEGAMQVPEVAQPFQRWVCPAIRSPYINWMLHDATVSIQAIRPYGLGMFSGGSFGREQQGAEGHLVLLL